MHIKIDKHRQPCIIMHAVQCFCIMAPPTTTPSKGPTLPPTGTSENGDFLLSLGRRVRESRNRRGLTRKQVSQQADVSERHLAQLEMRRMRIALIGMRGAGKSTLGARLAAESNQRFVELDSEIERDTGMPLGEIFSLYGQAGFRAMEKRTLEKVLKENERAVVSTGGGIVSEKETFDYLLSHCFTVWIKARPEEHMSRVVAQGDVRPMAANDQAMEDLRRILEAREPRYRKADVVLDTSGASVEESFAKLKATLQANLQ